MVESLARDKRKKPELADLPEWPRLLSADPCGRLSSASMK